MRKLFTKAALLAVAAVLVLGVGLASAGKMDDIKAKGEMVAGVKDSTKPFGYVDEQTKQIVGFDVDILAYIANKMGVKLKTVPVTSATRIPMLTQGSVDILAATMTHKISRDDQIDFSITYFMDGQRLLAKKGGPIKSVKDLAGKKVGTAKGSTSELNVKKAQPTCTVLSFEDYPQAFLALKQGKVAAVTTDASILTGLRASDEKPGDWEIVGDAFSAEPYGLGVPENDSKFRDFVNKSLIEMWNSGEYLKTYNKWFGKDTKYYIPLTWTMETWPE